MARVVGAVWACFALSAACYSPTPIEGEACSETNRCPEGLVCDPASLTCVAELPAAARFAVIDVGYDHTCGIDLEGAVWCWGAGDYGSLGVGDDRDRFEPERVAGDPTWEKLSVGRQGTCGIRSGGELWCWGTSNVTGLFDQDEPTRLVDPVATWIGVHVGVEGFCAETATNELYCRYQQGGAASPPTLVATGAAVPPFKQFSGSDTHLCVIDQTDDLWCWGGNNYGQVGNGSEVDPITEPQRIMDGTVWRTIAVGQDHVCAIADDGALWCWGECNRNQTGQGDIVAGACRTPARFGADRFRSVDPGDEHTCAVREDGVMVCFGLNDNGELGGLGGDPDHGPVEMQGIDGFDVVSSGNHHSCGLRAGGEAWCWGGNFVGQLGDGRGGTTRAPVRVHDGPWQTLSLGTHSSCGIRDDGSLWCWGKNPRGQLGDGTTYQRHRPVRVGGDNDWIAVAAGYLHGCGIRSPGTLWCWGDNDYEQLGTATSDQLSPYQVGLASDWTAVTASELASCGVRGGALYCWGSAFDDVPEEIDGGMWSAVAGTGWASFGGGFLGYSMCAAKAGELYCGNDSSMASTAIDASGWTTLSHGWDHGCGMTPAGATCIGDNEFGQLGDGTVGGSVATGIVVMGGPYRMIDAGDEASCAITTDDRLYCWGLNDVNGLGDDSEGFVGVPVPTEVMPGTTWRTVDVAHDHGCAADAQGALWCWGQNDYGERGDGGGGSDRPVRVSPPESGGS